MWTMMQYPRTAQEFLPNHFSVLHERETPEVHNISASSPEALFAQGHLSDERV